MYTHTLLLVDDSITIERELRSAFADEPIQIVVAVNGHRALDRIEADRPAVVLASTSALGVNGYGLAHYVSQRPYLSNVAVLLLTGNIGPSDTHRMKESGARGFVRHPIEPGIVLARVKEVLMLAGPEVGQADVLGPLATAFDAIDASMTSQVFGGKARHNEIAITPDALARIVNDAVSQAIAAYEQARSLAPEPAPDSTIRGGQRPRVVPTSPGWTTQQQLQRDMGLNDIEFESSPSPPAQSSAYADLAAQMGVDDLEFEAHESTRRIETSEPAAIEAPVPEAAGDFAFGVDDLPPRGVAPDTVAAPSMPSETDRRAEESDASVPNVMEPLRDAVVLLGTALADQASRIRSALAERARRRAEEPAAPAVLAPEPAESQPAPAPDPEPAPAPAPEPAEPNPAPAEPNPAPAPEPPAPPRPQPAPATSEEAAKSIFFTFDPIPPVPPPIPREPRDD